MKQIDFSKPGGFRLTQDQMAFLQTAWTEAINGVVAMGGSGPSVVSGAVITRTLTTGTTYNYSITAGWIWYNGVLIKVAAMGPVAVDESINIAMLVITPSNGALAYNDGSSPTVLLDATIGIAAYAIGTADDATKFAYGHLVPFGREAHFTNIAVATASGAGSCTGTISYRKNFLSNTLELVVGVAINTPSDCPAMPGVLRVTIGNLPTGYQSVTGGNWVAEAFTTFFSLVKDSVGGHFSSVNLQLTPAANGAALIINFVLPDAGVASYSAAFSGVISLG